MKTRVRAQGPWGPRDWMGQPHMPAISNVGSWSNPMWMEWTMRSKGSSDSRPMRLTMSSLEARKRTPRRAGIEQPAGGLELRSQTDAEDPTPNSPSSDALLAVDHDRDDDPRTTDP